MTLLFCLLRGLFCCLPCVSFQTRQTSAHSDVHHLEWREGRLNIRMKIPQTVGYLVVTTVLVPCETFATPIIYFHRHISLLHMSFVPGGCPASMMD